MNGKVFRQTCEACHTQCQALGIGEESATLFLKTFGEMHEALTVSSGKWLNTPFTHLSKGT